MIRACVVLLTAGWLCPPLIVGSLGLGLPPAAAVLIGAAAALGIAWLVAPVIVRVLTPLAAATATAWLGAALLGGAMIVRIAVLSLFMADVNRPAHSMEPDDPFRLSHSCLSSYAEAARFLAEGGHNIYDTRLYQPRRIGPLNVDAYHYPPPFLLLPRAIDGITADFWRLRSVWFAMQVVTLGAAILVAAAWVGGVPGGIVLLGGLVLLLLPNVGYALQQGNFQSTASPLAVMAVVWLSGRRPGAGGLALAYAAVGKIFPGILVVYFAAARQWRAVAWTAGWGIVLLAATLATQGIRPTHDFVTHALPEISSGAAFPHAERPNTSALNWTVYGATVRLRHLGVAALDRDTGLRIASIYGVLIIALAAFAGWRARIDLSGPSGRLALLQITLGLVALASFRSPFAGAPYGIVSTLWLMTLLAAGAADVRRAALWLAGMFGIAMAVWSLPSPADAPGTTTLLVAGLLFLLTVALNLLAVSNSVNSSSRLPAPAAPQGIA